MTLTSSPRLRKGGIMLVDAESGAKLRFIPLQYNPHTLTRTLQAQSVGGEGQDRAGALRLTGPPQETYKLEAEIDAADLLEFSEKDDAVEQHGIQPQLAALEAILYPDSGKLQTNNKLAAFGILEILPVESPMTLFIWSKNRVLPVRLTEFSVTEEAFDKNLNPLRAKVSLGMRVLNINDLGFDHSGGQIFMAYHRQLEKFAKPSG